MDRNNNTENNNNYNNQTQETNHKAQPQFIRLTRKSSGSHTNHQARIIYKYQDINMN